MRQENHSIALPRNAGTLHVRDTGPVDAPVVYLSHSILSSHGMWAIQERHLAAHGWRVLNADIRGHGDSLAHTVVQNMDDLVEDVIATLDALDIATVHYVGLSLGGMIGFGLGIEHPGRLDSLCLCDARADAPEAVARPWDERIQMAATAGSCSVLVMATMERWFGKAFMDAHPAIIRQLAAIAAQTSLPGFIGAARAIQSLNYLPRVSAMTTRTTLIVGEQDGALPQTNQELASMISGAQLEIIPDAGHLPNINHPIWFNRLLNQHLSQQG